MILFWELQAPKSWLKYTTGLHAHSIFGCECHKGNEDTIDPVLVNSSDHSAIDAHLISLQIVTPGELEKHRQVKALGTVGN